MPTPKPIPSYKCSQAELYAICNIGWNSCGENLVDFTAHNTKYNAAYVAAALTAINDAKLLPGEEARGEVSESLRIQLKNAADAAFYQWKKLRSYINSAFPEELVKPKEEAAGYNYYQSAYQDDWEDLEAMLTAGKAFLDANGPTLTAGGMPPAFPAEYDAAFIAFTPLYQSFMDARQDAQEGTAEKVNANNAIHKALMDMFSDGILIFENNPEKRDRFIFDRIKELVSTPGTGTVPADTIIIGGTVTESGTGNALSGIRLRISVPDSPEPPRELITDMNGRYLVEYNDVPDDIAADAQIEMIDPNWEYQSQTITAEAGNTYEVNFEVVAVP